jgi:hypothetical protein
VSGGSANAYAYSSDDPVNNSDTSGESSPGLSGWLQEQNNQIGQEVIAREAAREAAARAAAEAAAAAAASAAEAASGEYEAGPQYTDPTHTYMLTAIHALALGEALIVGGSLAKEVLGHYVGELAGAVADMAAAELAKIGGLLETCSDSIAQDGPHARCRLQIHTLALFGKDLMIPWTITVSPCFYFKKSYGSYKRGLHCDP